MENKLDSLDQLRIDRNQKPNTQFRLIGTLLSVVTVIFLAIAAWLWLKPTVEKPVIAELVRVSNLKDPSSVLDATGYVIARLQAAVSAQNTGKIKRVLVEEGMSVKKGDVVAYLDDKTQRAQLDLAMAQTSSVRAALAETRTQLKEAEKNLQRTQDLANQNLVSQADLDAAQASKDVLQARLLAGKEEMKVAQLSAALSQQLLDETIIRAPFDGVIVAKTAQPGEIVSPVSAGGGYTRTGICTIVDMTSLEIEVDVNEAYIQRIEADQPVTATLDAYPDWHIPAKVIAIVPTADRQKATVKVRIGFLERDNRILPDMGIRVAFLESKTLVAEKSEPSFLLPRLAVGKSDGQDFVFVIQGQTVAKRLLQLGEIQGQYVQVISGLEAGERVVVEGPEDLKTGDPIVVKN